MLYRFLLLATVACSPATPPRCDPPVSDAPQPIDIPPQDHRLVGSFMLTVVAQEGIDTIVRAHLHLSQTASADRRLPNPAVSIPAIGFTEAPVGEFPGVKLAYATTSRDDRLPGVQAVHNSTDRNLILMFGAAFNDSLMFIHQGLLFRVFQLDSSGFRGRWQADYPSVPNGFFCATKVEAS